MSHRIAGISAILGWHCFCRRYWIKLSAMPMSTSHGTTRTVRRILACALTAIYLMISLGPVASVALHPGEALHALAGACSGDCDICGCSPESRAAGTCCCSKTKQRQARLQERARENLPDCCKKAPAEEETVIASCGCPCGDDSHSLAGVNKVDILPYRFHNELPAPVAETRYPVLSRLPITRPLEPPVPPPKQA